MMSGSRPSIFSEDDADTSIDLSGFSPKADMAKLTVPPETLEQVSEENGFPSRAPKVRTVRPPPLKRPPLQNPAAPSFSTRGSRSERMTAFTR
jgi:hypothetical protein